MFETLRRSLEQQGNKLVSSGTVASLNKEKSGSEGSGTEATDSLVCTPVEKNPEKISRVEFLAGADDWDAAWSAFDELSGPWVSDGGVGQGSRSGAAVAAAAAVDLAPELCNTGAMTRHEDASSALTAREPADATAVMNRNAGDGVQAGLEAGGLDTLHIGIYGEWSDAAAFDVMGNVFDVCSRAAKEGVDAEAIWEAPGGDRLQLQASGAMVGIYCRWIAEWNGCRVYFVNRREACERTHSVFVQFGSLALMTRGHNQLWADFCGMLAAMGFRMSGHKISRVDVCTDHVGLAVKEITSLALGGHEITRAKKGSLHVGAKFSDHETWYRGGDRLKVRIYDKLKEVRHDLAKRAVLVEKRWGCEPDQATRVEFEVHRDVLKERWEIDTMEDLNSKLRNLVEWLTSEWYRLAAVAVDVARENNNQSRVEVHPLWKRVQTAFATMAGSEAVPFELPRRKLRAKVEQLWKQGSGCIVAALAIGERTFADAVEFGEALWDVIAVESERMFDAFNVKRQTLAIEFGAAVAGAGGTPF